MRRVLGKVSGDQGHKGRSYEGPPQFQPRLPPHSCRGRHQRPRDNGYKKADGAGLGPGNRAPPSVKTLRGLCRFKTHSAGPRVGGRGGGTGREPGGGERPLPSIWSPPAVPKRPWGIAHQQSEAQLRWGKASVPLLCGDIRLIRKPLGRNNVLEIIIVQGGWKK